MKYSRSVLSVLQPVRHMGLYGGREEVAGRGKLGVKAKVGAHMKLQALNRGPRASKRGM